MGDLDCASWIDPGMLGNHSVFTICGCCLAHSALDCSDTAVYAFGSLVFDTATSTHSCTLSVQTLKQT